MWGLAELSWSVHSGEEKTDRRSHCSLKFPCKGKSNFKNWGSEVSKNVNSYGEAEWWIRNFKWAVWKIFLQLCSILIFHKGFCIDFQQKKRCLFTRGIAEMVAIHGLIWKFLLFPMLFAELKTFNYIICWILIDALDCQCQYFLSIIFMQCCSSSFFSEVGFGIFTFFRWKVGDEICSHKMLSKSSLLLEPSACVVLFQKENKQLLMARSRGEQQGA